MLPCMFMSDPFTVLMKSYHAHSLCMLVQYAAADWHTDAA
jgi:hypothetical protein